MELSAREILEREQRSESMEGLLKEGGVMMTARAGPPKRLALGVRIGEQISTQPEDVALHFIFEQIEQRIQSGDLAEVDAVLLYFSQIPMFLRLHRVATLALVSAAKAASQNLKNWQRFIEQAQQVLDSSELRGLI